MRTEYLTSQEAAGFYTLRQAATELGIQRQSVKRAISRGTLKSHKVRTPIVAGGYYRVIRWAEIERYRREHLGNIGRPQRSTNDDN